MVIDDDPRDAFKKDTVFGRDLICGSDEYFAGFLIRLISGIGIDQALYLVLQELAVGPMVIIPDHEVDGQAFQAPVGMRLYHLSCELQVFLITHMQQYDRDVTGHRMAPKTRLASEIIEDHSCLTS